MHDVTHARFVMQPVRDLTAIFALHRNAIAFAIGFAGQGILANFLIFKLVRLQPHAQVLTRLIISDRLAINRRKFKAGDKLALRLFRNDTERTGAFPATNFAGVLLIKLRFTINKHACEYTIGFTPGVEHFLTRAVELIQRRQQMRADNVVLLRFDLKTGVFLRDFFHGGQQNGQILQIAGVSGNGVKQRFTLVAVALIAHVENLFQLRVVREHTVIKMGGQLRAGRHEQGNGGLHGCDGLSVKHSVFLFSIYIRCIFNASYINNPAFVNDSLHNLRAG